MLISHRAFRRLPALLCWYTIFLTSTAYGQAASPAAVPPELLIQSGHSDWVTTVAFSPDGKRLVSGGRDNVLKLWDVASRQLLANLKGHTNPISSVAFNPDGQQVATASWDRTLKLWDAATGKVLRTMKGHAGAIWAVAFSPDGKRLASASEDRSVRLWDTATGQVQANFVGHKAEVLTVAFTPDGMKVASGSRDNTIMIWDAAVEQPPTTLAGHTSAVMSVSFSPDGKRLASGSEDGTAKLWDLTSAKAAATLQGHAGPVISVTFSPDGKRLASGSYDQTVKLWDTASGQPLSALQGHAGPVSSVAFSPEGKFLASGSYDQTVRLWNAASGELQATLKSYAFTVRAVAFSPDSKRLVSGSEDSVLKLWDTVTGKLLASLKGHADIVWCAAFSPDGRWLASGSADKEVKLWDATTGKLRVTLQGHPNLITSVAFSPDGKRLASAGVDKVVKLWDAASGQPVSTLQGAGTTVIFSSDGTKLVAGSGSFFDETPDPAVRVWDLASGQLLSTWKGHTDGVWALASASDGKRVATGSADKDIHLWDPVSGQSLAALQGHAGPVSAVAFSSDGKRLASGSWDNTVKLWDATIGQVLGTLKGHYSRVTSVAFSSDGKRLASGSEDGTVRLWNGETGAELGTLIPLDQADWVTFTPDGRFDTSLNGARYVTWKVGTIVQGFEQYKEQYYVPDLWTFLWSGQPLPIVRKDIRQGVAPPPEVAIISPKPDTAVDQDQIRIVARVKDTGGGVTEIRCYQQGKLITHEGTRGVVAKARKDTRECQVALQPGANEITVTAFNADNIESQPAKITVHRKVAPAATPPPEPEFWMLSIGINRYKNKELMLRFARPDAEAVVDAVPLRAKTLLKQVYAKTLYDDQVTRATVVDALTWLKSSKPQDTVVIYVAGHGVTVNEKYYFLPHDVTEVTQDALAAGGVSDDVWSEGLLDIPSLQMFIAIDTCQSGGLMSASLASLQKRALSLMGKTTGVYVLAAATDKQSALEDTKLGHGAFTYILLKGINGDAKDRKGRIMALDLVSYVQEEVPNLTEELFKRRQDPVANGTGRTFPLGVAP